MNNKTALIGVAQAVAILALILYVFGFIVVNTYLAGFGIVNLGFFEARYVPAGGLVLALLFIYAVTAGIHVYYGPQKVGELVSVGKKDGKTGLAWGIYSMIHVYAGAGYGLAFATTLVGWYFLDDGGAKLLFIPMLLFFAIDFPLREKGTLDRFPRLSAILLFTFYCLFMAAFFYAIDKNALRFVFGAFLGISLVQNLIQHEHERAGYLTFFTKHMLVIVIPTVLLAFCLFVGKFLYGEVSRGVGGGKPAVVRLLFADETLSKVGDLVPSEGNQSDLLLLIDETSDELILIPADGESGKKTLRLRKNLVVGIESIQQQPEEFHEALIRILKGLGLEVPVPDKD